MRAALIDAAGTVANVVVVGDGYTPPDGYTLVPSNAAGVGDSYADGVFTPPPGPPEPPAPPLPVSGDAILGAIAKADRVKLDPFDVARIAWRDDVPATNAKLGRIAKAVGTTTDALRQAAAQG